ncbi:hypothetical protein [Archangium sp.]|uniref:hypothetical protein n=1 Tax=Archangium sp. TaxID=1872627 RepID=UPI002D7010BA|nr:hypothetical protein [Archangium sp.]HYO57783.1 hypothetical protein [Archangium sp.]
MPTPPSALARTPLIVEPKAPPKPTAVVKKKDPEQFQFVGGRTSFSLPPLDVQGTTGAPVKPSRRTSGSQVLATSQKPR